MKQVSQYEQQALDFLKKHKLTYRAKFIMHGKHFTKDTATRDIYKCSLSRYNKRNERIEIEFGQSEANSFYDRHMFEARYAKRHPKPQIDGYWTTLEIQWQEHEKRGRVAPTAYDLLTSITKSNPGTFEDFCMEFGYDTDSRRAEKTYNAVVKEWLQVSAFFTPEQISELQEIN